MAETEETETPEISEKTIEEAEKALASDQNKKTKEVTKEQVLQSALGYFLPLIMQRQRQIRPFSDEVYPNDKNELPNDKNIIPNDRNVFQILYQISKTEKQMPAFTNILTKKDANKDICDLDIFKNLEDSNLFLNQVVPYVRIYKTLKNEKGEIIDINLPFDVVTGKENKTGENIEDKILRAGSGGSVGIVDFSWKSEGRNEGNNSLYAVNFKIFLQDVKELERIRNTVGENSVKILDLLYYGFLEDSKKQEDTTNPSDANEDVFESDYLEFKAEVGFSLPAIYQEYEEYFKTLLDLRVYKHNFTFKESGNVELDITAIGNLESSYSNKIKYNILETEKIKKIQAFIKDLNNIKNMSGNVEKKTGRLNQVFDKYRNDFSTIIENTKVIEEEEWDSKEIWRFIKYFGVLATSGYSNKRVAKSAEQTEDDLQIAEKLREEPLQEKLEENIYIATKLLKRAQKVLKVNILNKLFNNLQKKQQIQYLVLSKQDYDNLKFFISFGDDLLDSEIRILKEKLAQINVPSIKELDDSKEESIVEVNTKESFFNWDADSRMGDFSITENDFKSIKEKINEGKKPEEQSEIVPFVFLGDLLQVFIDEDPEGLQKDINIFLSPFSYYNYKETFSNLGNPANIIKTKKSNKGESKKTTHIYNVKREIGEMYNIPISIKTIQKWIIDSVLSTEEEAYSFNKLLRYFTSDLIRQNISGKVAPAAPNNTVKINPYYFSADDENLDFLKNAATIEDLASFYTQRLQTNEEFKPHKKNIAFISTGEISIEEGSFTGQKIPDCSNNIMHLPVNSMHSFVKKISFARDDDARLETANLQARTDAHENEIVRQVYQANVEMYGNTFFEPGNLVFLKPNFPGTDLDMETMYRIGLGGYYRIIEITNKLSVGGFSTSLKCMWEMSKDGTESVAGITPTSQVSVLVSETSGQGE